MGVDISGINPVTKSPLPEEPNWETSTDLEKDLYWEDLSKWREENPGAYFRANWWSWRPIVYLIDIASDLFNLGINTEPLHYNDGKGLETQEECDKLANALEHIIDSKEELKVDDAKIYFCLGSWCTLDGGFIDKEKTEKLNKQYPLGTALYTPIVLSGGEFATPAHGVDIDYVKEFISFLRNCGGFRVY